MINTREFVRFALVGGSTALVHLSLTWMFVDGLNYQVTLGSTIALILTGMYNYSMHYYWTFGSDAPHGRVLVKYLLMCLGALVVNALVMHFGVLLLPIHYLIIQFLANLVVALWNFFISSLWVFGRRKK